MEDNYLDKIIELSKENGLLKKENEYLKEKIECLTSRVERLERRRPIPSPLSRLTK